MGARELRGVVALACACAWGAPAAAQTTITTDGTFGPAGPVPGVGGVFEIGEALGNRPDGGPNLFQRLGLFDVGTGDTALFTADPGFLTQNIITQITGGETSDVNGAIDSNVAGANLWLFNSAGWVFGNGSSVNVLGDFHVSSADALVLEDGARFGNEPVPPGTCCAGLVSAAAPAEFGFTSATPGGISIVDVDSNSFDVVDGGTLSLIGGDVFVDGAFDGGVAPSVLDAAGGTIQLASLKGAGAGVPELRVPVDLAQLDVNTLDPARLGEVRVGDGTRGAGVDVSGMSPGKIVIRGGRLELQGGSQLNAGNSGGDPSIPFDAIDVQVANDVVLSDGSQINSDGFSGARAGRIALEGATLTLENGSSIRGQQRTVGSTSPGGGIDLAFSESVTASDPFTTIATKTLSNVPGGDIAIRTGELVVEDGAAIVTLTERMTAARAGGIDIDADHVRVSREGLIASAPKEAGFFIIDSGFAGGGDIEIDAQTLVVEDGADVAAASFGAGASGRVLITAEESVMVAGGPLGPSLVSARTEGVGAAGNVEITTAQLEVVDGGLITVGTDGVAPAGDVRIDADGVRVAGVDPTTPSNRSGILAQTQGPGAAGTVEITGASNVIVEDGGQISVQSSNVGAGPTGDIVIETDRLTLRGTRDAILASSLSATEDAGNVDITARSRATIDGAGVAADPGEIAAPVIRTESAGASGGNITVSSRGIIEVTNAQVLADASNSPSGADQAGAIALEAPTVIVTASLLSAQAGANANGGSIELDTQALFVAGGALVETGPGVFRSADSIFDVSSELGVSGSFVVTSPDAQLTSQVAALSASYLDANTLAANACAARDAPVGSLIVEGRDRVARAPDQALPVLFVGIE